VVAYKRLYGKLGKRRKTKKKRAKDATRIHIKKVFPFQNISATSMTSPPYFSEDGKVIMPSHTKEAHDLCSCAHMYMHTSLYVRIRAHVHLNPPCSRASSKEVASAMVTVKACTGRGEPSPRSPPLMRSKWGEGTHGSLTLARVARNLTEGSVVGRGGRMLGLKGGKT